MKGSIEVQRMDFVDGRKRLDGGARKAGRLFVVSVLIVALVFSIGLASLFTQPVSAAFPGANGKIAFVSDRDGDAEIFVMNSDGSGQTQLTFNTAADDMPAWSPDGSKIVFLSTRDPDGDAEIFVMNSDGSSQTQLTFNTATDVEPAWSPDGSKIVCSKVIVTATGRSL